MAEFRPVANAFWVAGQLETAEAAEVGRLGVRTLINNRPDGEESGQPKSDEIAAAAADAGLDYIHAPVRGWPAPEQVRQLRDVLESGTPALAFCRSGLRSIAVWALAELERGARSSDENRRLAEDAGYSLPEQMFSGPTTP